MLFHAEAEIKCTKDVNLCCWKLFSNFVTYLLLAINKNFILFPFKVDLYSNLIPVTLLLVLLSLLI
jgi:hypothetical protein